jgi:hypothetical protein
MMDINVSENIEEFIDIINVQTTQNSY